MKLAICVPGDGDVPAAFAYDLANLVGYLARERPLTEVRLLGSERETNGELREALLRVAREWGADVIVFPDVMARIPPHAFDAMLTEVGKAKILVPGGVN